MTVADAGAGRALNPIAQPNRALLFIVATVAIDMVGIGLILPVLPELIARLIGPDQPAWTGAFAPLGGVLAALFGAETGTAGIARAAAWGGLLTFVYALMQFVFSPILGALSDRFGRRPVLLLSLFTLGVDYLIMGFAGTVWVLFIGRALSGASAATYATANAFIADITPKEKRAARYGMLGAAFGLGFVVGPAIGGWLGEIDVRAPFFAAAGFAFLNTAFGFFVLPETLAAKHRRAFSLARANAFGALRQLRRAPEVAGFVIVITILQTASMVYPATWSYFTIEKFGWSSAEVGGSLAFYGVIFGISQAVLVRVFVKHLGHVRTILMSMIFGAVILVGVAMAQSPLALYGWITLALLSGGSAPALQAMMTSRVGEDVQGELQGAVASLNGVVLIVSPLMMTQIFRRFSDGVGPYFPGAPYAVAAGLVGLAFFVFLAVTASERRAGRGEAAEGA